MLDKNSDARATAQRVFKACVAKNLDYAARLVAKRESYAEVRDLIARWLDLIATDDTRGPVVWHLVARNPGEAGAFFSNIFNAILHSVDAPDYGDAIKRLDKCLKALKRAHDALKRAHDALKHISPIRPEIDRLMALITDLEEDRGMAI